MAKRTQQHAFANPSLAPGCVVTDSKLRLNAKAAAAGRTLEALRVTGDWSEGAVTWSNQPATSGTAATVSSGTGYREWNVTTQVRASYENGVDRGFLIRDANTDDSPASRQWTVVPDATAPETTIDSGPTGSTTNTSATFAFSSSESGSTFECSLDQATFTSCTSPRQYTGLGVGSREIRVRATDASGNTDETPAVRTWTVTPTCSAVERRLHGLDGHLPGTEHVLRQ